MAQTKIEWSMRVWNATTGCRKKSHGCKNCYAEKMHKRLMVLVPDKYSRPFLDGAFLHEPSLPIPLKWKKPTTIFVNSMSDLFEPNLSLEDIAKVYAIMFLSERHTYQVLTKHPDRRKEIFQNEEFFKLLWKYCNQYHDQYIKKLESEMYFYDEIKSAFPFYNIWEGTTIENKDTLHRSDDLRATPAAIRWISAEPLLENISEIDLTGVDWIVVGGESGHKRRPFNPDWSRDLRDKCKAEGVKFFMKQIDKKIPIPEDLLIREYPKKLKPNYESC